jgi:hypothetical protein
LIFASPQILRRQFEKLINAMAMREYRIFAGPPALIVQLPFYNLVFLGVKIGLTLGGLIFVPSKGSSTYMTNKRYHGLLMIILFIVNVIEFMAYFY